MLLSSIQIQGFKSFADKTTLKFGKGITGIVGPNGSGKSNISDAVRWVLGEQSTKSLRGQSMEDVIFSGTASRRPHGYCEVTLNIDNSDRTLNFDDDFVSVTRRYYRSHESEYLINNVSVRLKDVNELFMDTGLGRDGYSMVGQGKIDAIIGTKSQERRDIFEEASGISKYRYRKIESERKLAAAEDNLLRLRDIMKELEERVGPLETQSKKAQQFLELSAGKKELEIGLWLNSLENFKESIRNYESKITACEVRYKEIEESISKIDEGSETNIKILNELNEKIEDERQSIAKHNEQIAVLSGNISVIENDILHNNAYITRLENEINELNLSKDDAFIEIEKSNLAEAEKNKEIERLNTELSAAESELNGLLGESENFSKIIEELSLSINALTSKSADLRVTLLSSSSAIDESKARIDILNGLIEQKTAQKAELNKELEQTNNLYVKLCDGLTGSLNVLKGYEIRRNSRKAEVDELKEKLDEIHLDIESKKRRKQMLIELERNMEGFSHSVKSVMEESKSGLLRGVHGTVASIINVKKEYSVAIETALGNALQNIIVDSDADAKRAINSLKQSNNGRATFLPISSIKSRPFNQNGYENMFGYVGIAADIVECDAKYNEIIKYLLGAVVVTEDIDSAVTIAKKFNYHFKVVSLDGQVINAGGSFTGGSLIKNAGLLSRKEDIKKIEKDVNSLTEKEKTVLENYNKSVQELSKVEADIVSINAEITSSNEDKIRAEAELKRLSDIVDTVSKSINDARNEKIQTNEKIADLEKVIDSSREQINELEVKKAEVQIKLDSNTGGRDSLSTKREEISEKITALKLQIIENQKDIESIIASRHNIENSVTDRAERILAINNELSGISDDNNAKKQDIEKINATIIDIRNLIIAGENNIKEYSLQHDAAENENVKLRSGEREITFEREKVGGELVRLQERKETISADYDKVIKQLYDEYQLTRGEAEEMGIVIENPSDAKKRLNEIKNKIRSLGSVNVSAIEEYKEVSERYDFMSSQISDVEKSRVELHKLINQLTTQMQEMFMTGFTRISENFSKTFTELFGGGNGKLSLTDPDNILESGIDIIVSLPGKNVPSIDGLSGGEKALVALAIYFSIMKVNAPPFCFLDEVDTALDDINVDRVADYMKSSDLATQFICVTHRRGTMEAADMLYGVTMQEKGITKLLKLNVSELEKKFNKGEI